MSRAQDKIYRGEQPVSRPLLAETTELVGALCIIARSADPIDLASHFVYWYDSLVDILDGSAGYLFVLEAM